MIIYLDFDGVIFDTVSIILDLMTKEKISFSDDCNSFFEKMDWEYILNNAEEINNSVEYIKNSKKNIKILTHVSSILEMQNKINFIIDKIGNFEIICVPKSIRKSLVVSAKNNILIDDSKKNVYDWENNGGKGILFNSEIDNLKNLIGE